MLRVFRLWCDRLSVGKIIAILKELVGGHSFVNDGLNTFSFFSWILRLLWGRSRPKGAKVIFHFQFRRGRMRPADCGFSQDTVCVLQAFWNTLGLRHRTFSPLCASRSIGISTVKREKVSLLLKDFYWNIDAVVFYPRGSFLALKNILNRSLSLSFSFSSSANACSFLCIRFDVGFNVIVSFSILPWYTSAIFPEKESIALF